MADYGWRRKASRLLLDCPPWLQVYADDVDLPNGSRIDGYLRVESRPHAMVFAVTDDGRVPLVRQYKYAVGAVVVQLPSGLLDEGEEPEACARRELLEETGYEADDWTGLGSYYCDGNRGSGLGHFYLARSARP